MGDFGKRVGLVHELRKLACPEKLLYHRGNRFRIDEVVGHQRFDFLKGHSFLDGPLHPYQADTVLVFEKFADRAHPAVSEIIYVIDRTLRVFELYQLAHCGKDVFLSKHPVVERHIEAELQIELEPSNLGQIVVVGVEKQVLEKFVRHLRVGGLLGRSLR